METSMTIAQGATPAIGAAGIARAWGHRTAADRTGTAPHYNCTFCGPLCRRADKAPGRWGPERGIRSQPCGSEWRSA